MKKLIIITSLSFLILSCKKKVEKNVAADSSIMEADSLTNQLQEIQEKNILPGFAVSIFTNDEILYQKGFGYSNINTKQPYSINSVQMIASITKTLIGVSLMKAVEDGKLTLDEEVNDILPYKVTNPMFPNKSITIRHLATHTSSISDTKNSDKGYRFETPILKENFPEAHHKYFENLNKLDKLSMANYLQYKLSKQGRWYEESVFISSEPGLTYEYSNLGATLLAHCIEIRTGKSFKEYTDKLILKSLKMNSSTWDLDEVNQEQEIIYYNEILNEVPRYRLVSYPDGGLYSSVSDLTKYLQEMMKGYSGEGELLTNQSYQEMMTKQYDNAELTEGLCWDLGMGTDLIGHSGNDYGTSTLAYFSPSTGIGRILFSNISIEKEEQEDAFYGMYNLLFKYQFNKSQQVTLDKK